MYDVACGSSRIWKTLLGVPLADFSFQYANDITFRWNYLIWLFLVYLYVLVFGPN